MKKRLYTRDDQQHYGGVELALARMCLEWLCEARCLRARHGLGDCIVDFCSVV